MSGSTSYTVSARLQVTGNAEAVLRALGRQLVSLNSRIAGTERNLQRLLNSLGSLNTIAQRANQATTAMGALRDNMRGLSTTSTGANRVLERQEMLFERNARSALRMSSAAQQAARSANALASANRMQALPSGGARRRGGGDDDDEPRSRLRSRITNPGPWEALYGARAAGGSIGGILRAGGTEQQAMTMLRAQGVSDAEREAMRAAATRMVREVPGASMVEALGAIRETRMALGPSAPIEDVLRAAPDILRTARVSAATGERSTAEGLRPFARFSAITGGFTDESGERNLERGLEQLRILRDAIIAFSTGPREGIDPREWEGMAKQGGIALRRMSPEGQAAMATLMQERGGFRTGTELSAFSNFVVSQQGPQNRLARATGLGLRANSVAEARQATAEQEALTQQMLQAGRITEQEARMIREYQIQQGEFRGRGFAAVRPDIYISDVFRPTIARRGATTEEQQLDVAGELFPRETSRRFVMAMLQVREVMEDILARRMVTDMRARGEDPTGIVLNEGFTNSLANMQAGFTNLLTALGNAPSVVELLNRIATNFNDLAEWVRANPGFMENLVRDMISSVGTVREAVVNTYGEIQKINANLQELIQAIRGFWSFGRIPGTNLPADPSEWRLRPGTPLHRFMNPLPGTPGAVEPLPPSWGGPDPRVIRPQSPIQEQSFSPLPGRGGDTIIHSHIYMDGREVAESVSRHQGRAVQGPVSAAPRHDRHRAQMIPDGLVSL